MTSKIFRLSDDNEGIRIGTAGTPEPTAELLDWLARECPDTWRLETDTASNIEFHFSEPNAAARFKARWGALEL